MKKRFFGVLLAVAALAMMAGSAFAAVELVPSISITVGSGTAVEYALSLSESALSTDVEASIVALATDPDKPNGYKAKDLEEAAGKGKYVYKPADVTITTNGSSAVKIASTGKTELAFKGVLTPRYAYELPTSGVYEANFNIVNASDGTTYTAKDPAETASFTPKASSFAYLLAVISDDSYDGTNKEVLVKLPVKVAQASADGSSTQTPTAFYVTEGMKALFGNDYEAREGALQQYLGDRMGEGVLYPTFINGNKATKGEVSEIKKANPDASVVYPSLEAGKVSAYVMGLLAPDMTNFEEDHFKFDRSTKNSLQASVAKYGEVFDMGDVLYVVYDSDDKEFREYEESDGQQDIVFMAFHLDTGTYQPFISGTATPTGTEPTVTPTGTEPTGTEPTGTEPTGTEPTGTSPTGAKKSSGSSGCDMGMVSGLAILLAALLPLRKVRK